MATSQKIIVPSSLSSSTKGITTTLKTVTPTTDALTLSNSNLETAEYTWGDYTSATGSSISNWATKYGSGVSQYFGTDGDTFNAWNSLLKTTANINLSEINSIAYSDSLNGWEKFTQITGSLAESLYESNKSAFDDLIITTISELGLAGVVDAIFGTGYTVASRTLTFIGPEVQAVTNNGTAISYTDHVEGGEYPYYEITPIAKRNALWQEVQDTIIKGYQSYLEPKLPKVINSDWNERQATSQAAHISSEEDEPWLRFAPQNGTTSVFQTLELVGPDFLQSEYNCAIVFNSNNGATSMDLINNIEGVGSYFGTEDSACPFTNASFTVRIDGINIPTVNTQTATLSTGRDSIEIRRNKKERNTKVSLSIRLDERYSMLNMVYALSGKVKIENDIRSFLADQNLGKEGVTILVKKERVVDLRWGEAEEAITHFLPSSSRFTIPSIYVPASNITWLYKFEGCHFLGSDGNISYNVRGGRVNFSTSFIYSHMDIVMVPLRYQTKVSDWAKYEGTIDSKSLFASLEEQRLEAQEKAISTALANLNSGNTASTSSMFQSAATNYAQSVASTVHSSVIIGASPYSSAGPVAQNQVINRGTSYAASDSTIYTIANGDKHLYVAAFSEEQAKTLAATAPSTAWMDGTTDQVVSVNVYGTTNEESNETYDPYTGELTSANEVTMFNGDGTVTTDVLRNDGTIVSTTEPTTKHSSYATRSISADENRKNGSIETTYEVNGSKLNVDLIKYQE